MICAQSCLKFPTICTKCHHLLLLSVIFKLLSFSYQPKLLLARLIGQYYFAGCRLSFVVIVCNAAGERAGRPPGVWTVGAPAAGRVGGRDVRNFSHSFTAVTKMM